MSLPIVLVTGQKRNLENQSQQYGCHYSYLQAVSLAGGIPLILSDLSPCHADALAARGDVLLMTGGQDVDPTRYGEENGPGLSRNIDEERDAFELAVLDAFVRRKKPVFGICRGLQVINVYFRGSLIQDLFSQRQLEHPFNFWHSVRAVGDSLLSEILGPSFTTNSEHHQAIDDLGEGLEVIATADPQSEIIEAVRHKTLPILAVQWHPERLCLGAFEATEGAKRATGRGLLPPPDMLPLLKRFVEESVDAAAR